MYEVRCPECQHAIRTAFVRKGAVVDCPGCSLRYRIDTEHIQRMMLVVDPTAEGELGPNGAVIRAPSIVDTPHSTGELERDANVPADWVIAGRRINRQVAMMWSSIGTGAACLILLLVVVINLTSGGGGANSSAETAPFERGQPHNRAGSVPDESLDRNGSGTGMADANGDAPESNDTQPVATDNGHDNDRDESADPDTASDGDTPHRSDNDPNADQDPAPRPDVSRWPESNLVLPNDEELPRLPFEVRSPAWPWSEVRSDFYEDDDDLSHERGGEQEYAEVFESAQTGHFGQPPP
ncbi:MAG: hypothetical protein JJU36_12355 [Phycisphaeraceae bacterium]|nr:hypothetical protein [Phycisphaeraceae bacterium]